MPSFSRTDTSFFSKRRGCKVGNVMTPVVRGQFLSWVRRCLMVAVCSLIVYRWIVNVQFSLSLLSVGALRLGQNDFNISMFSFIYDNELSRHTN